MTQVFAEINRRESLMPAKVQNQFKIKYGRTVKDQKSKRFIEEVKEYEKAEFLLHALETNPLLREICENQILVMVLNSATSQGLQKRIHDLLRTSQVSKEEAVLLYASDNKVKAMEDCI